MPTAAVRVENLGKKYLISHRRRERYTALRDVLTAKAKGLGRSIIGLGRVWAPPSPSKEEFWAVRDVSFEANPGSRIGVIGRNGAGKSTLLKLLSRITEPSAGRIEMRGRVASLLEVGTGFHPELTGRENIFLNGAILGMSKEEVRCNFDEIVAFAEVENFLDTAVKHFSSGMYVRLAFAVAAHLQTEILMVDEVLAVGDAEFQKKCLGKMRDVAGAGRTVIFVSHNMEAVLRLCTEAIYLQRGTVAVMGDVQEAVSAYLRSTSEQSATSIDLRAWARGPWLLKAGKILFAENIQENGWARPFGEPLELSLGISMDLPRSEMWLSIAIFTSAGTEVAASRRNLGGLIAGKGLFVVHLTIPNIWLVPGRYTITFGLHSSIGHEDHVPEAIVFTVTPNTVSSAMQVDMMRALSVFPTEIRIG